MKNSVYYLSYILTFHSVIFSEISKKNHPLFLITFLLFRFIAVCKAAKTLMFDSHVASGFLCYLFIFPLSSTSFLLFLRFKDNL